MAKKRREPQVIITLSEYERLRSQGENFLSEQAYRNLQSAIGCPAEETILAYALELKADAELGEFVRKMPDRQFLVHSHSSYDGPWSVQEQVSVDRFKTLGVGETPEEALRAALEKSE